QEVVAVTAEFHDVAGVNEAVVVHERRTFLADIAERGPPGTDAQRTVLDLHLHLPVFPDQGRWKTLETIVDFKRDARFGRSKSMPDGRLRVERTERIQDRLVGDLA